MLRQEADRKEPDNVYAQNLAVPWVRPLPNSSVKQLKETKNPHFLLYKNKNKNKTLLQRNVQSSLEPTVVPSLPSNFSLKAQSTLEINYPVYAITVREGTSFSLAAIYQLHLT